MDLHIIYIVHLHNYITCINMAMDQYLKVPILEDSFTAMCQPVSWSPGTGC